tara:strand:+ start:6194 stop:6514 length:321 start_codon:yes stop_codon:yes gene_type:complete
LERRTGLNAIDQQANDDGAHLFHCLNGIFNGAALFISGSAVNGHTVGEDLIAWAGHILDVQVVHPVLWIFIRALEGQETGDGHPYPFQRNVGIHIGNFLDKFFDRS